VELISSQAEFCAAPVVCQFSSMGSLRDERSEGDRWLEAEFFMSLNAGKSDDGGTLGAGPPQARQLSHKQHPPCCDLSSSLLGRSTPPNQKSIAVRLRAWQAFGASVPSRARASLSPSSPH
jgi:hypothetical protein